MCTRIKDVALGIGRVTKQDRAVELGAGISGVAHALARRFTEAARGTQRFPDSEEKDRVQRGSGKSGEIRMTGPRQEMLTQTAILIEPDGGRLAGVDRTPPGLRRRPGAAVSTLSHCASPLDFRVRCFRRKKRKPFQRVTVISIAIFERLPYRVPWYSKPSVR